VDNISNDVFIGIGIILLLLILYCVYFMIKDIFKR